MNKSPYILICFVILFSGGCKKKYSADKLPETNASLDISDIMPVLDISIENYPDYALNYYHKAKLEAKKGNFKAAIKYGKLARDLNDTPENHYFLAQLYDKTGGHELALENGLVADRMGVTDYRLDILIANQYLELGAYSKAFDYLNNSIVKQPENAEIYYLKGMAYLKAKDTLLAEKIILQSLSKNPAFEDALFAMVDISKSKNEMNQAMLYLGEALTSDPDRLEFHYKLSEMLRVMGNIDSAKAVLRNVLYHYPKEYKASYKLAGGYYSERKYDSAQYYALKSHAVNKSFIGSQLILARIHDRRGSFQLAEEAYESILALDSTNNFALEELDKLKRKVAYLWQLKKNREEVESLPTLRPKKLTGLQ